MDDKIPTKNRQKQIGWQAPRRMGARESARHKLVDRQYTKKGYTTLNVKDQNGRPFIAAVRIGSRVHGLAETKAKQINRDRNASFRNFKENLRYAKRSIPLADRAKVNWSEVQNV